ncbi:MAG TPA: phenylalanine--tRNA ligase subunit beta [Vicinamibacteria bacterium]|nr:phenylalanine--tRNA ligase subunit beta [Vicinamibacteria bacterium]
MRLPLSWLREHVAFEAEPARLAGDLTAAGLAVDAIERVGEETVLDLDVTTNRVDCMNVHGVAREVAALYGLALRPIDTSAAAAGPAAAEALDVQIEAPDLCGRFCARLLDVKVGPSPSWLRDRLELVGVRSINNVVDLTNYVMIEMGQPSHAFDLKRVPGGGLVVRWSREGERLTTLDGVERVLPPRVGVIAGRGGEPALALAGIMGGASSEISEATRVVALEAAWWEPLAVRRAARALAMHTEASHRFERGADVAAGPVGLDRLAHLLLKIGAGTVRPGLVERRGGEARGRTVRLRPARVSALLGVEVPRLQQVRTLESLGFLVTGSGPEESALVPTWRLDVAGEADLAEEVGRHFGLQRIEPALPPATRGGRLRTSQKRERRIRDVLAGAGLVEVVNYAFVAGGQMDAPAGERTRLANPLTEDQDTLRASLVMPGLLDTLAANLRLGRRDVAVFELGRVFLRREGAPREERRLAVLLSGSTSPHHWSMKPRPFDLFDIKGLVELLFARLGEAEPEIDRQSAPPRFLHPGRSLSLRREGRRIGHAGAVHPDVRAAWELRDEAVVLEIGLDALLEAAARTVRFSALDRFPAVERDLSILSDEATPAAEVDARVRAAAGAHLRSVSLLDRYSGNQVPPGKVSLTVSLRFQDPERTLTSEEVQDAVEGVVRDLRAAGFEIRGERG